ncbi:MAG TPA: hypothetical protein VIC59_11365 [Gemmatimonadota bacterium]|jgi:hypothetical protein
MKNGLARASFGVQHVLVLGTFAQAALAGFFLYTQPTLIHLHKHLGSLLIVVALAVFVLSVLTGFERRHGLVPLAAVQLVLMAGQFVLGTLGRNVYVAAALHVPNAFIVFTVSMLWLVRARRAIKGER